MHSIDAVSRIRGLYGIADAAASRGDPEALAVALLAGGCRLVQLRCKGWTQDDVLRAALAVGARCRAVGATFVVNDLPHVAVEADADGVHVGPLDAPPHEVRRIVGDRMVGRSTHSLDALRDALPHADYVAFGPIWATANAGRDKGVRGLDALREARGLVPPPIPLVAIGGITAERLPSVRAAGADAWAVIGAIAHAADPIAATRRLSADRCLQHLSARQQRSPSERR